METTSALPSRCSYGGRSSISSHFLGCQSNRLGFTSGAGRTSVSWSLVQNPLSTPHQYFRNYGYFIDTEEGSSIHKELHGSISTDNTTVVAYLSGQGGTHSPDLCMEVWKTLIWCHQNQINLLIKHIPGKFNVLADGLSRIAKPISTEWALNQSVANAIFRMTQFPNLVLFATRLNHKVPLYLSPIPDPKGTFNRCSHNELESHTR